MLEDHKPKRISDEIGAGLEGLPVFQLNNLIDELGRSDDDEMHDELQSVAQATVDSHSSAPPSTTNPAGSQAAADFLRCARAAGLTAICDALAFCRLTDELPKLFGEQGVTVLTPTDEAFAHLTAEARGNARLVRQLLLAHICLGTSSLAELESKHCAVALAGQTHAVYKEEPHTYVGTGMLGRHDIRFEGGIIHEVHSVLVVLQLARDSHSEQVWKKTLQPAPMLSLMGGANSGAEYEVHGCLLHAATGQLVPEALRGHIRNVAGLGDEQKLTFSEITVMTKPPSLAKRRGMQPDGTNRYRLLFSLWNTSTLSYVSWQHMATPLVVRNSFHMLPLEEKNYRRQQQYARARGGPNRGAPASADADVSDALSLPSLPELAPHSSVSDVEDLPWLPLSQAPGVLPGAPELRVRQQSSSSLDSGALGGRAARSLISLQPDEQLAQLQQLAEAVGAPHQPRADLDSIAPELGSSVGDVTSQPSRPTSPPKSLDKADWNMGNAFSFGGGGLPSSLPAAPLAAMPTPAPVAVVGSVTDISAREGPAAGGTAVWLTGIDFPADAVVRFGGVAAQDVQVVSPNLIKCASPPLPATAGRGKHEVGLQLFSAANGAGVACAFTFSYVENLRRADLDLLSRAASSIERAQAAAGASGSEAGSAAFLTVDEHGYSLSEYAGLLRKMLHANDLASLGPMEASELQMQHQELATMLTRERLSMQIARRPPAEALLERNILQGPEAEQMHAESAKEKRLSLAKSLMNRPLPEQLQDRNILRAPENETQQKSLAAKRKRLSDFLLERPTIDQLQGLIEESNLNYSSLDQALEDASSRRLSDASL